MVKHSKNRTIINPVRNAYWIGHIEMIDGSHPTSTFLLLLRCCFQLCVLEIKRLRLTKYFSKTNYLATADDVEKC